MRVLAIVGLAVALAGTGHFAIAQYGPTPWPSVDFDPDQAPDIFSFYRTIQFDRGSAFLDASTFAILGAPQLNWTFLKQRAENELWTDTELQRSWDLLVRDWERNFTIYVYPQASELANTIAGRSGNLTRFVLETSTGYREAIAADDLPARFPDYNADRRRYENSYSLSFDRRQALAPGTEWIRL